MRSDMCAYYIIMISCYIFLLFLFNFNVFFFFFFHSCTVLILTRQTDMEKKSTPDTYKNIFGILSSAWDWRFNATKNLNASMKLFLFFYTRYICFICFFLSLFLSVAFFFWFLTFYIFWIFNAQFGNGSSFAF